MTETQSRVLRFLADHKALRGDHSVSQKVISENLQLSRGYVSRTLSELKEAGYIEIEPSWLTAEGEEVSENYRTFFGAKPSRGENRYRILRTLIFVLAFGLVGQSEAVLCQLPSEAM